MIRTLIREVLVGPGTATLHYTIPISQSTTKTEVLMVSRFGCDSIGVRRIDRWACHLNPDSRFDPSQMGPTWMVGSTIFEMWLGALCNAQVTRGLHNGGRGCPRDGR